MEGAAMSDELAVVAEWGRKGMDITKDEFVKGIWFIQYGPHRLRYSKRGIFTGHAILTQEYEKDVWMFVTNVDNMEEACIYIQTHYELIKH